MFSLKRLLLSGWIIGLCLSQQAIVKAQDISSQVLIRRTQYGVPHIQAKNIEAAGYAMGYLQMEDYGKRVINGLIKARGEWARYHELHGNALKKQIDADAASHLRYARAIETYPKLNKETQNLLKGYALGINKYIELHPNEFPKWVQANFTAYDVHAKGIGRHSSASVKKFIKSLKRRNKTAAQGHTHDKTTVWSSLAINSKDRHPDVGSNAWALAPDRTTSGKAILLRNPHLSWNAGYYEAQMKVAGKFNFYGDFRIGQPLGIVGGFNKYLGWSTTNNYPETDEIYAFAIDPDMPGHYLLDGVSHPVKQKEITVKYKKGKEVKTATRTFLSTPYGPVIYQTEDKIYLIRSASEGEYRTTEQFLRMMEAGNLEEWKEAMRMQARYRSNFTYADRDGNIFYVWNASIPILKHKPGHDTTAIFVTKSSEIWTHLFPWDKLPHLLNPKGGYLHNENDPFYYTNLNEIFHVADFPDNFPKPKLGLRSQLALQLIGNNDTLSLEDVIKRKHDMTMLLADRVKDDLIRAIEQSNPSGKVKQALTQLKDWDNSVARESRGGILFKLWWERYVRLARGDKPVAATPESAGFHAPAKALFSVPWSPRDPARTPYGLAHKDDAVSAFKWAIQKCEQKYGTWDLSWGDIHRAKIGKQDYPVGGASGTLGCFRVLWYTPEKSDKRRLKARGGDGWILAVEFDDIPRAYSVLAYGESAKKTSPYHGDQLKLFANNKMKPVFYTEKDIKQNTIRSYHPGQL